MPVASCPGPRRRWRSGFADLDAGTISRISKETLTDFHRQLEVALGTLTVDSPGDITMNSSAGSELDMFRRLHHRLDLTSMRWLRSLMSTSPVREIHEIPAIDGWEDMQRKDCNEELKEQQMIPELLQGHLELNLSFTSCALRTLEQCAADALKGAPKGMERAWKRDEDLSQLWQSRTPFPRLLEPQDPQKEV